MLPKDKSLKPYSRELRNNATKQENHLWYDFLRKYHLHFYRQRIIGAYIVDFYCPKAKLVIEVDGSQHYEEQAMEYDAVRTEYLNALELRVIRFSNGDIDNRFNDVCQCIEEAILSQLRQSSVSCADSSFGKGAFTKPVRRSCFTWRSRRKSAR